MSGFSIPNKSDIGFPFQSRIFQSDFDILSHGVAGRYGTLEDSVTVSASVSPAMNVVIAAGAAVVDYELVTVPGETLLIEDADPLLPRFDTIVVNSTGDGVALTGLADAAPFPVSPAADQTALAQVYVPAAATAIQATNIVDKRVFVPTPIEPGAFTLLSATADLTRANNAAISLDPQLQFPVAANTTYRVRFGIEMGAVGSSASGGGIQVRFAGPASTGATGHGVMSTGTMTGVIAQTQAMPLTTANTLGFTGFNIGAASVPTLLTRWMLDGSIIMTNGASAGTFGFAWAQSQAATVGTIRYKGSYLEYEAV